jgi:hypothetical protein
MPYNAVKTLHGLGKNFSEMNSSSDIEYQKPMKPMKVQIARKASARLLLVPR